MLNQIINNWYFIVVGLAVGVAGVISVITFLKQPRAKQLANLEEWLIFAVAAAEKQLGVGTGALKLRYVYDAFVAQFPALAKILSFEQFSALVDKALDRFKEMLESNQKLKELIEDDNITID